MKRQEEKAHPPPEKQEPVNRIRFKAEFCIEWTKGILKSVGTAGKRMLQLVADFHKCLTEWPKGPWPWL